MHGILIKMSRALALIILFPALSSAQSKSSPDVMEILKWFPADTNAVTVANGPFPLSDLRELEHLLQNDEGPPRVFNDDQLRKIFQIPALTPWARYHTQMTKQLLGERVLVAVEGFRPGEPDQRPEWCTVLVFERESIRDKLLSSAAGPPLVPEDINGHGLVVIEDKSDKDGTPSLIVGLPGTNVLIVSESLGFLKSVLARARGETGPRALPENLPEWLYVDRKATFWALGHVSGIKEESDQESDTNGDFWKKLKGATISFDPATRTGRMVFVFDDPNVFQEFAKEHHADSIEDEDAGNTTYREIKPGVVASTTVLANRSTTSAFVVYGVWLVVEP